MSDAHYLAIVTARAGSKRLPNKNGLDFCGRPLFIWSVNAGLECPEVAKTLVTTDSPEYQALALAAGASCPRLRSPKLSSDQASSVDVVADVLDCEDGTHSYTGLILLQPTSPLRTADDISAAIQLHQSTGAPAVVSVCEAECPPAWIGQIGTDLRMDDFIRPEFRNLRSQDLGTWYRLNGAVYVIGIDDFRSEQGFMPQGTVAYIMPRMRSIDIDTAHDFELAQRVMEQRLDWQGDT